jgi:phage-related holin
MLINILMFIGFSVKDINLILNSTLLKLTLLTSSILGFVMTYFLNLTIDNSNQYLAITAVILLDGFFGVCAGIKREGFKTYKAIRVLKNIITWWVILTVILLVEMGIDGTDWLSETIMIPFVVFEIVSALKNASMAGFIKKQVLNDILDSIDKHKGERIN